MMRAVRSVFWSAVVSFVIASSGMAYARVAFTHLPSHPVPEKPIALRVDADTIAGGNVLGPHTVAVSGQLIRIEGCLGTSGLPIGIPYSVTFALTLPIGNYAIEYYRNVVGDANCQIGVGRQLELVGTGSLNVAASGPNWPPPPGPVAAVYEYLNYVLNSGDYAHYFMTILDDEKLAIEIGQFTGWARAGPTPYLSPLDGFGFFRSPAVGLVPVCRFFSAAFAPKSSHFYTANPTECEIVKWNSIWTFEGVAGYVWPPRDDGSCAQGMPLFRLYNNGVSGAPNHYYTEDPGGRSSRINSGWTPEGVGLGVIACVPLRP